MNTQEALKILEVTKSDEKEKIKKNFRKLAAKFHPDVNKSPDAEEKFKKINEAYNLLTNPQEDVKRSPFHRATSNFRKQVEFEPLHLHINITFEEAVLGFTKKIPCQRYIRCETCEGTTGTLTSNNCKVCDGRGKKVHKVLNFTVVSECDSCGGRGAEYKSCDACNGEGAKLQNHEIDIKVPGGIEQGESILIPRNGHFISSPFGQGYQDAVATINYPEHPILKLDVPDVISTVQISLLEALQGCSKEVETVKGKIKLKIPPKIRNKETLRVVKYGCQTPHEVGNHIFTLDVIYPNNVNDLIETLQTPKESI
jgi:molecular chaperone DnaJ